MNTLATIDELPAAYRQRVGAKNLVPLWPLMRAALPHDKPMRRTRPVIWRYRDVRPELLEAGDLAPIEKAERRVLALANPVLVLRTCRPHRRSSSGCNSFCRGRPRPIIATARARYAW